MSKVKKIERPPTAAFLIEQHTKKVTHSGPLPSPEILEGYERVSPGFANRIFEMAEREQKHRHDSDDAMVKGYFGSVRFGQICAVSLGTLAIAGGTSLQSTNHSWALASSLPRWRNSPEFTFTRKNSPLPTSLKQTQSRTKCILIPPQDRADQDAVCPICMLNSAFHCASSNFYFELVAFETGAV